MKYLFVLSGLVCLSFMLLPACAPQAEEQAEPEPVVAPEPVFDQAAEEAAVRQARKAMIDAFNNHDPKAMVALVAEINENWQGTRKGRKAYEENATASFETYWKDMQYKDYEEISITFVTPDVAIYKARAEGIGGQDSEGKPRPPRKDMEALVYKKIDGSWLEVAYFSRPIPE